MNVNLQRNFNESVAHTPKSNLPRWQHKTRLTHICPQLVTKRNYQSPVLEKGTTGIWKGIRKHLKNKRNRKKKKIHRLGKMLKTTQLHYSVVFYIQLRIYYYYYYFASHMVRHCFSNDVTSNEPTSRFHFASRARSLNCWRRQQSYLETQTGLEA